MGRLRLWLLMALFSGAIPLPAQQGPERAAIDSLLSSLELADSLQHVPTASRCDPYRGSARKLCRGLIALKRAELSDDRDVAIAAEFELVQVAREQPRWGIAWYGLGMARLELSRARVLAKESLEQATGMSFEAGAGNALVRALEVEPGLAPALTALALASIPREGASVLGGRLAMLRRHGARLGAAPLLGAAKVERVAGSRDTAVALLQRALASGAVDSGVVLLELARDLHAAGQAEEGRAALFAGVEYPSVAAQAAYRQELSWVAEPAELAAWDSLPVDQRPVWLKRFWRSRDVAAGWPEGTRLIEHFARLEHAWNHFTLYLPRLGRHKLSGRTSGIDLMGYALLTRKLNSAEVSDEMEATQRAVSEDGNPTSNRRTFGLGIMIQDAIVARGALRSLGVEAPFRAFRTGQSVLDDRGVVWIRYGRPQRTGRSAGGEALEVWAYDLPQRELLVQFREEDFDGQVGASMLVPTFRDVPGWSRDQFCGISARFCVADTRRVDDLNFEQQVAVINDGGLNSPARLEHDINTGLEEIRTVTTSDAHPRQFEVVLTPVVQLLGLHRVGGSGHLVAAFAIPGRQLEHHQPALANGRFVYSVRFTLSAIDQFGERIMIDTLRHFAVSSPLQDDEHITGVLELPVDGARVDASLLVTQQDGRGTVAALRDVSLAHPAALSLSSLVLGRIGGGIAWQSGTMMVPLHPLNAFPTGGDAELYFQVGGLQAGTNYQTRIELIPEGARDGETALALAFSDEARSTFAEVQRTVGLRDVRPGRYRIRVTVSSGGGSVIESGVLTVTAAPN